MKKVIIILIILLMIATVILLIIINKQRQEKIGEVIPSSPDDIDAGVASYGVAVTSADAFYLVESCLNKYLSYLYLDIEEGLDEETGQESLAMVYNITKDEEKKQAIYDVLDKEYITENNVTIDNIYDFVEDAKKDIKLEIVKMYHLENVASDVQGYSVYCKISNIADGKSSYEYFIIKTDNYENAFVIYPLKAEDYKNISDIKVKNNTEKIEKNERNVFANINISESDMARKYFYHYKNLMIENPESAYVFLDKEYREKRFGNLEEYKKYVNSNLEELKSRNVLSYAVNKKSDYTEYICKDQYENEYIFKAVAVMEYSLILDTYTLDLPEFLSKYNNADSQGRTALNIQKFVDSINQKDYKYAYSKLAENFKNTNFPSLQSFETFIKSTFYSKNKVEYILFNEEANLYTYQIYILDIENEKAKPIERTIIMQLGEGTDFVMSFNIK